MPQRQPQRQPDLLELMPALFQCLPQRAVRLHDPADQQRLVDLLLEATEATMRYQPGYVSANIHKSLDGTHVVNYAQWRSQADFEAMLHNPEAQAHMGRAADLARVEPHLYEVVYSDEGDGAGRR